MSDAHPVVEHDARVHEAGIDVRKIVVVGAAALFAFVLCTLAALAILRSSNAEYQSEGGAPPAPAPIMAGKLEIGIVEQVPFDADRRLPKWKADMRRHLTSYGWVDQSKGIVRVPVDKAMQQVVDQAGSTKK